MGATEVVSQKEVKMQRVEGEWVRGGLDSQLGGFCRVLRPAQGKIMEGAAELALTMEGALSSAICMVSVVGVGGGDLVCCSALP